MPLVVIAIQIYLLCVLWQVSLYEDDTMQDKSHAALQTSDNDEADNADCFDSIPISLQVSSAANHAPWVIQRTVARSARICVG